MILTLKELAEYLRVTERTVLRMLHTGKIQGAKIGGQWRFNGSQIDKVFFPSDPKEDEEVPMAMLTRPHIGIPISRLMKEERCIMDLKSTTKTDIITELTDPRLLNGLVLDIRELREKCLSREDVLSTGIANGIAIPHPRDPISTLRAPACVIYGYSKQGIDFDAEDGKKTHIFFMICSQNIELHLHLMGCLARLLSNDKVISALTKCENSTDIMKLIMENERADFLSKKN